MDWRRRAGVRHELLSDDHHSPARQSDQSGCCNRASHGRAVCRSNPRVAASCLHASTNAISIRLCSSVHLRPAPCDRERSILHESGRTARRVHRSPRCALDVQFREFATAGRLMSYGGSISDWGHQGGVLSAGFLQVPRRPTSLSIRPRSLSCSSTSRPPRRSASRCRRRCSPAPTR